MNVLVDGDGRPIAWGAAVRAAEASQELHQNADPPPDPGPGGSFRDYRIDNTGGGPPSWVRDPPGQGGNG